MERRRTRCTWSCCVKAARAQTRRNKIDRACLYDRALHFSIYIAYPEPTIRVGDCFLLLSDVHVSGPILELHRDLADQTAQPRRFTRCDLRMKAPRISSPSPSLSLSLSLSLARPSSHLPHECRSDLFCCRSVWPNDLASQGGSDDIFSQV